MQPNPIFDYPFIILRESSASTVFGRLYGQCVQFHWASEDIVYTVTD
jgi:hypothetical protein